jgi:hypothetical protein
VTSLDADALHQYQAKPSDVELELPPSRVLDPADLCLPNCVSLAAVLHADQVPACG